MSDTPTHEKMQELTPIARQLSRDDGHAMPNSDYFRQAERIILALHEAGYVIVPASAVAAALERKEAAV